MQYTRFSKTPLTIVEGNETYGVWKRQTFLMTRPPDSDIGSIRITSATEGRPDLISNQVYGTPSLYWVLIAFNRVREPLNWPRAGELIEYPLDKIVIPETLDV